VRRGAVFITVITASVLALIASAIHAKLGSSATTARAAAKQTFLPGQGGPASTGDRRLPAPLYGVTVDDISDLRRTVRSLRHLPERPTTRVYFDASEPASYYLAAVSKLHPVSYVMRELLDSADETRISTAAFRQRVKSYLSALGGQVDLWEIGNEVNGSWTGPYPIVSAKLTAAYQEVNAAGGRTALTLYYNVGCRDGPAELSPLAFSRRYVPAAVRSGLDYVFLSCYEDDCAGIRPAQPTWTSYLERLHALYPHARLGFGEIGMNRPATSATTGAARSLMHHYYSLPIHLPYFAGGYFWWYYAEDCVPYASQPLWSAMRSAFEAEAAAQHPGPRR
jgi:hypothetical protein